MKVRITLENTGYASPAKAKPVMRVLRNTSDKTIHTFTFDNTDIGNWYTGAVVLATGYNKLNQTVEAR